MSALVRYVREGRGRYYVYSRASGLLVGLVSRTGSRWTAHAQPYYWGEASLKLRPLPGKFATRRDATAEVWIERDVN